MKKLMMSLVALLSMTVAMSQTVSPASESAPVDPNFLLKKMGKTKTAADHPKKGTKGATWFKYAEAIKDVYYYNIKHIFVGAEATSIVEKMGQPTNADAIPVETIGSKQLQLYKYPTVDIYMDMDNKVSIYVEHKPLVEDIIFEYEKALLKSVELDPKLKEKVDPMLKNVVSSYLILMQNNLTSKDYPEAIKYADKAAKLQENPAVNDPKSLESYYYAAVCGMQGEIFDVAKKYLLILKEKGDLRDGEVLYYLGYAEDRLGNVEAAKATYEEGIAKFPANQDIMKTLIDIYMRTKEDPSKMIPYIKQAQGSDPKNVGLYIAEGVAYEKMGQVNKSIEAYKVAIGIDPTSFIAYYNLGFSYSILADDIANKINKAISTKGADVDNLDSMYAEMNDVKSKAVPYLLKAHELNPSDINTVTLLRSIFFSLREKSSEMMSNFEKFDAIYKEMK